MIKVKSCLLFLVFSFSFLTTVFGQSGSEVKNYPQGFSQRALQALRAEIADSVAGGVGKPTDEISTTTRNDSIIIKDSYFAKDSSDLVNDNLSIIGSQKFLTNGSNYNTAGDFVLHSKVFCWVVLGDSTANGVYLYTHTDTSKLWVRKDFLKDKTINVLWAGAFNDSTNAQKTTDAIERVIYLGYWRGKNGFPVFFPPGVYLIDNQINLSPNRYYGIYNKSKIIRTNDRTLFTAYTFTDISLRSDYIVEDLYMETQANRQSEYYNCILKFQTTEPTRFNSVIFKNLVLKNVRGEAISVWNCNNVKFENIEIHNYGFDAYNPAWNRKVEILNCRAYDGQRPIEAATDSTDENDSAGEIYVSNFYSKNATSAPLFIGGDKITVRDSYFHQADTFITNNMLSHAGIRIQAGVTPLKSVIFNNVTIDSANGHGMYFANAAYNAQYVEISDCTIREPGGNGLMLVSNGTEFNIHDNTIINYNRADSNSLEFNGIFAGEKHIILENNRVFKNYNPVLTDNFSHFAPLITNYTKAHYEFTDVGTDSIHKDYSGNGNDLSLSGWSDYSDLLLSLEGNSPIRASGKYIDLNGTDFFRIPAGEWNDLFVSGSQPFTLFAWMMVNNNGSWQGFGGPYSGTDGFAVRKTNTNTIRINQGATNIDIPGTITDGVPIFIAVRRTSDDTLRASWNNGSEYKAKQSGKIQIAQPYNIGTYQDGVQTLNGAAILWQWNVGKAASEIEIADAYTLPYGWKSKNGGGLRNNLTDFNLSFNNDTVYHSIAKGKRTGNFSAWSATGTPTLYLFNKAGTSQSWVLTTDSTVYNISNIYFNDNDSIYFYCNSEVHIDDLVIGLKYGIDPVYVTDGADSCVIRNNDFRQSHGSQIWYKNTNVNDFFTFNNKGLKNGSAVIGESSLFKSFQNEEITNTGTLYGSLSSNFGFKLQIIDDNLYAVKYNEAGAQDTSYALNKSSKPVSDGMICWLETGTISASNGDSINTWPDSSSYDNDFYTYIDSTDSRPRYISSGLNGLPVVRFDGIDDIMRSTSSIFTYQNTRTAFIVISNYDTSGTLRPGILGSMRQQGRGNGIGYAGLDTIMVSSVDNSYTGFNIKYKISADKILLTFQLKDYDTFLRANGSILIANHIDTLVTTYSYTTLAGKEHRSSPAWVPEGFFNCDISEVIIYNKKLTTSQIETTERYLNEKYNIY